MDGERLTCSVPEAAKILGISRSAGYEAARTGELPVMRFGCSVRVVLKGLEQMIDAACQPKASRAA